jgi:PAS domain S-box-containing protein
MRLISFFSTVAFCFFLGIGLFAYYRVHFWSNQMPLAPKKRAHRPMESVFIIFCGLLALWAFATAFFVSAATETEALRWFRLFGFSWFFAPGTFVVFALLLSGWTPSAATIALPMIPGALITAAGAVSPSAVLASATRVPWGWHPVYAPSIWSALNIANTVATPLIAAFVLARVAWSEDRPRRTQARVVLGFFAPTFACSLGTGYIVRLFGVETLPPLTPSFFIFLVIGLFIATFRYGLLELTPFTDTNRILMGIADAVVLLRTDGSVLDSNLEGRARNGSLSSFVEAVEDTSGWLGGFRNAGFPEQEANVAFTGKSFCPASVRIRPIEDDDGSLLGYALIAHDLSAEKNLERVSAFSSVQAAALRSAENNFTQVFQLSPAGMVIIELGTGIILDANRAAGEVVDKCREELVGKSIWSLGLEMVPEALESLRADLRAGNSMDPQEITINRESSSPLLMAMAAVPIVFGDRNAALISFIDITELTFLRNELFKAQKTESIGAMAAGLAHDFNNILTAVMGNVSLARMSAEGNAELNDVLASAEHACSRAKELSRQLLLFARGGVVDPQPLDIFPIILETTRMALSGSSVSVSFSSEPDLPLVLADRNQFSVVFTNLSLNAVAAMPHGGTLKVRGFRRKVEEGESRDLEPGEYLCIAYEDESEGIDPERLQRIFDPYMHGKRKEGGMGLAVCETIVKLHGGQIGADSVRGKGTTFTVYLPALPKEELANQTANEGGRRRTKGTIILMDDEFVIRITAERLLGKLGYETIVAPDGEAVVSAFKEAASYNRPIAAVVLDLTVPGGMGGAEAASIIRSMDPEVPIYASSGYNSGPVIDDYASYGFSGVIPKPYTLDELASRLAAIR